MQNSPPGFLYVFTENAILIKRFTKMLEKFTKKNYNRSNRCKVGQSEILCAARDWTSGISAQEKQ